MEPRQDGLIQKDSSPRDIALFLFLTFLLSWSVWVGGWLMLGKPTGLEPMLGIVALGSAGPSAAAIVMTLLTGASLKDLLKRLVRVKAGWRAYVLALLVLPLTAAALTLVLGYKAPDCELAIGLVTLFPAAILNGIFAVFMGAGPLGEELGWRGYLLPRLLSRGVLVASLVIGVVWTLWHLPVVVMFADWRMGLDVWLFLPLYGVGLMALSYAFTQLWIESGGSLFLCVWFHGIVNAVGIFAFSDYWISDQSPLERVIAFTLALFLAALLARGLQRSRRSAQNA